VQSNAPGRYRINRQYYEAIFAKVLDGRKQPIRGQWKRNTRFYGQWASDKIAP
jgi:hypothetical protein